MVKCQLTVVNKKHPLEWKGITEQVQISKTASAQIQTFEKGLLKQAKEAVRIARTSFKFGEASLLDVPGACPTLGIVARLCWFEADCSIV